MDTLDFVKFSLAKREEFLNISSNLKELNIGMIASSSESFYLRNLYTKYEEFLHKLYDDYSNQYHIDKAFDECVCDFIDTMKPQIEDTSFITKNERCLHLVSIEYNMICNIHKFAYELYVSNHELCEKDFFHGTSLTELLDNNMITIKEFRSESFYDIDNFSHISLPQDYEYLELSKMVDIYMLNIASDIYEFEGYKDFFADMYILNSKGLLSKSLYRYLLTLEDVLYAKKGTVKQVSNLIMILAIMVSIGIFLFYYMS